MQAFSQLVRKSITRLPSGTSKNILVLGVSPQLSPPPRPDFRPNLQPFQIPKLQIVENGQPHALIRRSLCDKRIALEWLLDRHNATIACPKLVRNGFAQSGFIGVSVARCFASRGQAMPKFLQFFRRARLPKCDICNRAVELETAKTDENGRAVHEECYAWLKAITALPKDSRRPTPEQRAGL
jgi:hypothetical protein